MVWENLVSACRPGGIILLQTFENEASYENFEGLHQFNIALDDTGLLTCSNQSGESFGFGLGLEVVYDLYQPNRHDGRAWIARAWRKP